MIGLLAATGIADPIRITPVLAAVLAANALAFAWRIGMRFAFTAREYGISEGLWAIVRLPLANVIAIIAGRRAVFAYIGALLGHAAAWDKTEHEANPAVTGPYGMAR